MAIESKIQFELFQGQYEVLNVLMSVLKPEIPKENDEESSNDILWLTQEYTVAGMAEDLERIEKKIHDRARKNGSSKMTFSKRQAMLFHYIVKRVTAHDHPLLRSTLSEMKGMIHQKFMV